MPNATQLHVQGDGLVDAATGERRMMASSALAGTAAARSRRELRTVTTAGEAAAASRQLLQTAPFTEAEVEKIMCVPLPLSSSPMSQPPDTAPYKAPEACTLTGLLHDDLYAAACQLLNCSAAPKRVHF